MPDVGLFPVPCQRHLSIYEIYQRKILTKEALTSIMTADLIVVFRYTLVAITTGFSNE
jgi:hypothetical protein